MPPINSYSSCLPTQGIGESASAYYLRSEGLKFTVSVSTETLERSESWTSLSSNECLLNSLTGIRSVDNKNNWPAASGPHCLTMYPRENKQTERLSVRPFDVYASRTINEPAEINQYLTTSACHSKPKSSFRRFWEGLVQCFLPGIKFKK